MRSLEREASLSINRFEVGKTKKPPVPVREREKDMAHWSQ